jgi:hypothetical protein
MKIKLFVLFMLISIIGVFAQDTSTTVTGEGDLSDDLDLEAVSSIFGDSKDLEDFEKRLNDPANKISNLDLNKDGNVDYLKVVSTTKDSMQVITIQDLYGKDKSQDVAVIDVTKYSDDKISAEIIGNTYIYGPGYNIYPAYPYPPIIFGWFWGPMFRPWISPWFWGSYPPFFHPWRPFPPHIYHNNMRNHINVANTYHHTNVRYNPHTAAIQKPIQRNDYEKDFPHNNFQSRNEGFNNRMDLDMNRGGAFTRSAFPSSFGGGAGRSFSRPPMMARPAMGIRR